MMDFNAGDDWEDAEEYWAPDSPGYGLQRFSGTTNPNLGQQLKTTSPNLLAGSKQARSAQPPAASGLGQQLPQASPSTLNSMLPMSTGECCEDVQGAPWLLDPPSTVRGATPGPRQWQLAVAQDSNPAQQGGKVPQGLKQTLFSVLKDTTPAAHAVAPTIAVTTAGQQWGSKPATPLSLFSGATALQQASKVTTDKKPHAAKAIKRPSGAMMMPGVSASVKMGNGQLKHKVIVPGTHEDLDLPHTVTPGALVIDASTAEGSAQFESSVGGRHECVLLCVLYAHTAGHSTQYTTSAQQDLTKAQSDSLRKAATAAYGPKKSRKENDDSPTEDWQTRAVGLGVLFVDDPTQQPPHPAATPDQQQQVLQQLLSSTAAAAPMFYVPLPPRPAERAGFEMAKPHQWTLRLVTNMLWPDTSHGAVSPAPHIRRVDLAAAQTTPARAGGAGSKATPAASPPPMVLCGNIKRLVRELLLAGLPVPMPAHLNLMADPCVLGWLDQPDLNHETEVSSKDKFLYTVQELADLHRIQPMGAGDKQASTRVSDLLPELSPMRRLRVSLLLTGQLAAKLLPVLSWLPEETVQLEMQTSIVLGCLEARGLSVSTQLLRSFADTVQAKVDAPRDRARALAGDPDFNPASHQQVSKLLYTKLKYPRPVQGHNSSGTQVNEADLEALIRLRPDLQLPGVILEFRKWSNLLNKNITASWIGQAERDSRSVGLPADATRVFGTWNAVNTATGRVSASVPNIQAIDRDPIDVATSKRASGRMSGTTAGGAGGGQGQQVETLQRINVRAAYTASPGCVLLSADYSQVELRMLAHMCEDPHLISLFQDSATDVIQEIALSMRDRSVGRDVAVSDEERQIAKRVCYGIVYGMAPPAVADQLTKILKKTVDVARAVKLMGSFHSCFPAIKPWADRMEVDATKSGYVTTLLGRRRPLPNLCASDHQARNKAKRRVVNSIVQGSAADLMKTAMVKWEEWVAGQQRVNPHLPMLVGTVHDELLVECVNNPVVIQTTARQLAGIMSSACQLKVPLKVKVEAGLSWGEQTEVDV